MTTRQGFRVVAMDPRLVVDVDALTADGWTFDDALPTEHVTALLNRHGDSDLEAITPLELKLRLYKAGEGVRFEGTASGYLNRPCGRCLQMAPLPMAFKLGLTLFPAQTPKAPAAEGEAAAPRGRRHKKREREEIREEVSLQDLDDIDTGTYEAGQVLIEDILREQMLLEVPITHVCREDCRGLCQSCGADLNQGPCGCVRDEVDPRLAALASIKLN